MANTEFEKSVGGFWIKESRQGTKFWSGVLELEGVGKVQVVAFRNTKKEVGSNQPDIRLYLSKPREASTVEAEARPEVPTIEIDKDDLPPF